MLLPRDPDQFERIMEGGTCRPSPTLEPFRNLALRQLRVRGDSA